MPISSEIWEVRAERASAGQAPSSRLQRYKRADLVRIELSAVLSSAVYVGLHKGEEVVHADAVANARELAPPTLHNDRMSSLHHALRYRLAS
jgi:hypothetical protein